MSINVSSSAMSTGPGGLLHSMGSHEEEGKISGRVLLRLLAFVAPYRLQMLLATVMMLVATGANLLTPYLTKVAIDQNIASGDTGGLLTTSLWLAGALAAIYLASAVRTYVLSWVGQNVLGTLRGQLFRHLQELSVAYHDRHIVGITISRVINDVAVIDELLSQGLVSTLADGLLLVGTIVVMVSMEPRLALLTFSVMPLMVIATVLFSRRARVAFRNTREKVGAVVGNLAENISGVRVIQAFGQEETTQSRFQTINQADRDAYVDAMSLSFIFLPTVDVLSMAATCIVLIGGGLMVARSTLTLGTVVAFLSYVSRFFDPIRDLSQNYTVLQAATAGGERVLELLSAQPNVVDLPGAQELPPIQGQVELDSVSFAYSEDQPVLHDVDLTIEPGETIALVGHTGAGKTTIANLVARFYEVTGGRVLIDGHDVRDVTQDSLHHQMGLVPQNPILFPGTIRENIRFGRPDADDTDVIAAARTANADDFIRNLPDGYDTRVLEGGINLSGGQRQLLCIARAVLVDPRILILDEATSSVDTITEAIIQEALDRLLEGRTAIIIAHRLSTVLNADRIYVIHDGHIVACGTHEELLESSRVYRDLYERQFVDSAFDE
ncbi:MAG: ABC transporter ATP-binding protein [Chloroflexi bacterium]|nr:ABC transporter ATP-binding protein [Chloroflexota bacterium]